MPDGVALTVPTMPMLTGCGLGRGDERAAGMDGLGKGGVCVYWSARIVALLLTEVLMTTIATKG